MPSRSHEMKRVSSVLCGGVQACVSANHRRRVNDIRACPERREERRLLSYTVSQIGAFDTSLADGGNPRAIVADSAGNVFGIAILNSATDANMLGEVFEIPAGATTIQVLYRFTGGAADGGDPLSLVIDSSGNLFGTTKVGGANGGGTLFEIPADGASPTTRVSFPQNSGETTVAAIDSAGDVFVYNRSSVSELKQGDQKLTALLTESNNNETNFLTLGADGNLYGIHDVVFTPGGSETSGQDFEISLPDDMDTTLGTFDPGLNGGIGVSDLQPVGLAVDASGNVFGATQEGGVNNSGYAFEIVKGSGAITPIDFFNQNSLSVGGTPMTPPLLDGSGNLYGVSFSGGASGDGTLWEVPAGSGASAENGPQPALDLADFTPDEEQTGIIQFIDAAYGQAMKNNPQFDTSASLGNKAEGNRDGTVTKMSPPGSSTPTPTPVTPPGGSPQDELRMEENKASDDRDRIDRDKMQIEKDLDRGDLSRIDQDLRQLKEDDARLKHDDIEITHLRTQLSAEAQVTSQSNSEATTIANLNAQLTADQGNPAAAARIQKRIKAADALQAKRSAKIAADDSAVQAGLNVLTACEATVSASLTSIEADLASLPPPTITLSGAFASTPRSVTPGKKATASISVANTGTASATGALQVAVSARPAGTGGSADVPLATVTVKIHVLPGKSGKANLRFVVPGTLAAGTYSPVVQLDPGNAFTVSSPPSPIVSSQTFAVT